QVSSALRHETKLRLVRTVCVAFRRGDPPGAARRAYRQYGRARRRRGRPPEHNAKGGRLSPSALRPTNPFALGLLLGLPEEGQDGLRTIVVDGQGLDAQLLLDLQRLQQRAFLRHI